jgi:hypothetical protein
MTILHQVDTRQGAFTSFVSASAVSCDELPRIRANADALKAKAMQLTDAWEGVMFALSPKELENIAVALGFDETVAKQIHKEVQALGYAKTQGSAGAASLATYHIMDAAFLALRGCTEFSTALGSFGDHNLQSVLDSNRDVFERVRKALPDHASRMNFKPETAAAVLRSFGANVSADLLYELAPKYGTPTVVDLEGRRGVSAQFIRCVTLTLAASLRN